jgi:pyruvate,water dikinase
MKKSSGIITNKGGRTCHAAIVAREMGLNAVVGTNNCTELLKDVDKVQYIVLVEKKESYIKKF